MVDEGRSMQIGLPGSDVFGSVQHLDPVSGVSSSVELFATLEAMHQALMNNNTSAIKDNLDKVSSVHEHVVIQQSAIGSRMNRVETLTNATEDRDYTYKTLQSSMEDLDYVEDGDWALVRKYVHASTVIDAYYDSLSEQQVLELEEPTHSESDVSLTNFNLSGIETSFAS
jgi:hypothetical protein